MLLLTLLHDAEMWTMNTPLEHQLGILDMRYTKE